MHLCWWKMHFHLHELENFLFKMFFSCLAKDFGSLSKDFVNDFKKKKGKCIFERERKTPKIENSEKCENAFSDYYVVEQLLFHRSVVVSTDPVVRPTHQILCIGVRFVHFVCAMHIGASFFTFLSNKCIPFSLTRSAEHNNTNDYVCMLTMYVCLVYYATRWKWKWKIRFPRCASIDVMIMKLKYVCVKDFSFICPIILLFWKIVLRIGYHQWITF